MTAKQQYNYEYLQQFCQENNIILLKDYSNEKINRDAIIEGTCKTDTCCETFCKGFRQLTISGGFCKECTLQNGKNKSIETCLKKYGSKHTLQVKTIRDKGKETCLEKYGVEHTLQVKTIRDKGKETCLQKYGDLNYNNRNKYKSTCQQIFNCDNPSQNEIIKEKKIKTCLINHGVEHPLQNEIIKEQIKNTNIIKYGCDNPSQNEIIKEKKIKTCLINYGVGHPLQNELIFNKSLKSGYKYKSYIFPSGNVVEIQGYEPYALDELLQKECIPEENIIVGTTNVPEIWYLDSGGKKHRYYVDIFILSQNRMIEVKSDYTFKVDNDIILLKQQACKDAGYSCEIWVYNSKGEKVECIL